MEDDSILKMKMFDVLEAGNIDGYVPKNFKYVNRNSMPYIPEAKPIMDILTSILYISNDITCEKGSDGLYRFYYDDRYVSFDIGRSNVEEDAKSRGLDITYGSDGIRAYYGGKFLNDMFEVRDGHIVDVSDKFFDLDPRNMRDFLDVLCEDYADISHLDMTGYCLDRRDMTRFSEVVRFFAVACGMTCLPLEGTSLFSKFCDLLEAVTGDFDDTDSEAAESLVSACKGIKDIFKKWRTGRIGVKDEYFISPDDCLDGYDIILCSKVVYKKDKYCFEVPSHMLVLRRGGIVFVTGNCGFGGRMLGCLSSKKNFRYVGTDPCTETMYHLHELAGYIEDVTGREDSYELHCCGSEDFCGPDESIDFAFSSPPYFDLEVYSDEPTQCFNKFPTLEEWLEGYVRATIKNIYRMLRKGAVYAVNIADFTIGGSREVAYVDEWIRISTEEGMPLYDTVYLGVTARAGSAQQAAGELKKENILIFKKPL